MGSFCREGVQRKVGMAIEDNPLPTFDAPPVVETVIGVHFEPVAAFDIAQRVLFWAQLRDQFPALEEKAPVDEVREEFGDDMRPGGMQVRWQLAEALPSPRLWAKSQDGRHTIQIQQDALLVNWERDPVSTAPYWPYADRRRDLADKLASLDCFLRDAQLGEVRPTSCFATYINHIEYERPDEFAGVLATVLTSWSNETSDAWLPSIEQCRLNLVFPFPEHQGRLHVNVAPGVRRKDKKRLLRMDLTARGIPSDNTIDAALSWIDLGHEWIVRGFASLTRPEMHKKWKRTQ